MVQGGGMRGAYAAGALVELYREGGSPFDAVWATSSGAASAAYALAGQPQGIEIWRDHLHGARLLSFRRGLMGGPLLDLEYLIEEVFRRRVPLDANALHRSQVPLYVPMTDVRDGSVTYRDLTREDPFPVLRAAMSLPGAVTRGVKIGGREYVDGGVVDQLPLRRAIAEGAHDIVAIMTRPKDHQPRPTGRVALRFATRRFPGIRESLRQRHRLYEQELAAITDPPAGVRIRVLRPSPRLDIQRFTRRRSKLWAAIEAGRKDAQRLSAEPS